MGNGLTRDQMIHFVACNVLLGNDAFSYLLPRIYFLSVSFGFLHVSSFLPRVLIISSAAMYLKPSVM